MIAVDTNILVYAHRGDLSFHKKSDQVLTSLAESGSEWAIPWPCIHEFYAIVTHPKIFKTPTPLKNALRQIDAWLESPSLRIINELMDYWPYLKKILSAGIITGPRVHDARIAAICIQNNVQQLWSADRDFSRISGIKTINPLI